MRTVLLSLLMMLLEMPTVSAGPYIFDGTDANDHGCACSFPEDPSITHFVCLHNGEPIVVTNGSTTVTSASGNPIFHSLDTGGTFAHCLGSSLYTVASVVSSTQIELTIPFNEFGGGGGSICSETSWGIFCPSGSYNHDGWHYMQSVLENLAEQLSPSVAKVVVNLGATTPGYAYEAIHSAFEQSTLPGNGWTLVDVDGVTAIDAWLDALSTTTTGILAIPSAGNAQADLTNAEASEINNHATELLAFLGSLTDPTVGGAIHSLGQSPTGGVNPYGWLETIADINVTNYGAGGVSTDRIFTAIGQAEFPDLTDHDITGGGSAAGSHWHNSFSCRFLPGPGCSSCSAECDVLTVCYETGSGAPPCEQFNGMSVLATDTGGGTPERVIIGRGTGNLVLDDSWIWISKKEGQCFADSH